MLRAVRGDPDSVDVLHDDVRNTVLGGAAVEQTCDRGMGEASQRLVLATEAPQDAYEPHEATNPI